MNTSKTRNAPPRAGMLVESLRGLGYTAAAAIADIIDNSISAGATKIELRFVWEDTKSWISISDDGCGMGDAELEKAMQLGSTDPRSVRAGHDLGRFGMGLKTASFSQARVLTVMSQQRGAGPAILRWDLDYLEKTAGGEWPLLEGSRPGSEERLCFNDDRPSGTIVLWELLDRIVTPGFKAGDFIDVIDVVERHLAMVFHRLLDGGSQSFAIFINGKKVRPWDPFMSGHLGKRWESPEYQLVGAPEVRVQCHVLPHKDMLSTTEIEGAAGPEGWTAQQGFYIYRNRRLLAVAGWLRLGERGRQWTVDEAHRLARIRLDIPNTVDAEWNINVLKSTASPPARLRPQLLKLARETREAARSVHAYRGRLLVDGSAAKGGVPDIWEAVRLPSGATTYRISRSHPLWAALAQKAGPLKRELTSLLHLIEGTVPVQRIWLDAVENDEPPDTVLDEEPDEELDEALTQLYEDMIEALVEGEGFTLAEARERLARSRPFDRRPVLLAKLNKTKE